jgi:hypothetical protein
MKKRTPASEVRVVVEVDGNPIGVLSLDMERLWPLISHNVSEAPPIDWIDRRRFDAMMRLSVARNLSNRLQSHLYTTLGSEIVKAELDVESFTLRAEAAAQAFGSTRKDVEKLAAKTGKTTAEFFEFFWKYMMDEREGVEPKKAWKKAAGQR